MKNEDGFGISAKKKTSSKKVDLCLWLTNVSKIWWLMSSAFPYLKPPYANQVLAAHVSQQTVKNTRAGDKESGIRKLNQLTRTWFIRFSMMQNEWGYSPRPGQQDLLLAVYKRKTQMTSVSVPSSAPHRKRHEACAAFHLLQLCF